MRIVVFSDSHNNFGALNKIVKAQPTADYYVHLGDGGREFDDLCALYPDKRMLGVYGNCDFSSDRPGYALLECAGKRIFYTHGHLYSVKRALHELILEARKATADIALFGHTHIPISTYQDGLYLLNPGSVTFPPPGETPSYGFIDITDAGIVTGIIKL